MRTRIPGFCSPYQGFAQAAGQNIVLNLTGLVQDCGVTWGLVHWRSRETTKRGFPSQIRYLPVHFFSERQTTAERSGTARSTMTATSRRKAPIKEKDRKAHSAARSGSRARESLERALEEGLVETFPASDPVAVVQPLPWQWRKRSEQNN
jgi:hypothetical protein